MQTKAVELLSANTVLMAFVIVGMCVFVWWLYQKLLKTTEDIKTFAVNTIEKFSTDVDLKFVETKNMHAEAMLRVDVLTNSVNELYRSHAIQGKDIEFSDKRIEDVTDELKKVHKDNRAIRDSLHVIKGNLLTKETLEFLTSKDK